MSIPAPALPAAIRHRADAETGGSAQATARLLIDGNETGGSVSTLEVTLVAGADGATPHYHTRSEELFYVAEGELQVLTGDEIVTVGAGGALVVPRFMPHAFGAAPGAPTRILIALTPGLERFGWFRVLGRVLAGEAEYSELEAAQDTYDNHLVDAPQWWAAREAGRR
ncbi:cupin domain-containing protein [Nocardia sp. alder85J]|uniref:cupin domain-containing protein n=1 Tax=Nocardia sp. alder85J TaxID=2862949 RepID=UPI001CD76289|nr:cupin domain-containing protein [Nocardia sp. alder85J]MCX4092576.1 cupin domain-containing protein [Nocardia sp. alder85J]